MNTFKVRCINNTLEEGSGLFTQNGIYDVIDGTLFGISFSDKTKLVEAKSIKFNSVEEINKAYEKSCLDTRFIAV